MRGDAGQAGVDDRGDAVDGDGAFRDVGGEDELGLSGGGDGAILLGGRKIAVEGQYEAVGAAGDGLAGTLGTADLGSAGQEGEDFAAFAAGDEPLEGVADLLFERGGRIGQMLDGEVEEATGRADDGGVAEEAGDGGGIERGRHDEQAQLWAAELETAQKREGEVGFEVALVEFIENDQVNAGQVGLGEQTASEYTFREKEQAGGSGGDSLEADLVADGLAGLFTEFVGDAAGGHAGGDAAGLKDENLAGKFAKQRGGNVGGFAGAGFGFENQIGMLAKRGGNLRKERVDGQWSRDALGHADCSEVAGR